MKEAILTLNVGSSSLKFSVFDIRSDGDLQEAARGEVEGIGTHPHLRAVLADSATHEVTESDLASESSHEVAIHRVLRFLELHLGDRRVVSLGHRVVHGGSRHFEPEIVNDTLVSELAKLVPLAPLHQPHNLEGIRAARDLFPRGRHVACFDTAFHHHHDWVATTFALPGEYYEAGVRRYGFHGLSYEYIVAELSRIEPALAKARVIIAHLGNGASMCAVSERRSVDTSMGFSALDGLPMGTRSGAIDPGVLLYLMSERGMDAGALTDLLYRRSGLKGLSGLSSDVRDLEASKSLSAKQALDYFCYRARCEIGRLSSALCGLDAIIFTGGIGEHSARVRAGICEGLGWLGVELDPQENGRHALNCASRSSRVGVLVMKTDEEAMIARHVHTLLAAAVD